MCFKLCFWNIYIYIYDNWLLNWLKYYQPFFQAQLVAKLVTQAKPFFNIIGGFFWWSGGELVIFRNWKVDIMASYFFQMFTKWIQQEKM